MPNVEYCPRGPTHPVLWTSQVLVETELVRYTTHVGLTLPPGLTDPHLIATLLNDGVQRLVHEDFAFFKVSVTIAAGRLWMPCTPHAMTTTSTSSSTRS
ncbi:hypothetical protein P43SY_012035 [Pythium insidiosum]|uniref:Uncharacterized protein n=1 Tax=Pythium insidiosum TaxID=114742 RepID=A0AAD5Q3Q2_PYTIN|nr:hypothetical protein P43SY_012035 [Pythium insidiosum]